MAESTDHLLPLVSAAPLVTSPPQNPTPRRSRELKSIAALALSWLLSLWLTAAPALALNDGQQLVVESWRLVNQSYVDPDRFDTIHWKRLRQKALERSIQSSADAYDAIEAMLTPIGDPYTRLLRPADFRTLKANTEGSVSGVGLQLGIRQDDTAIVVIAPLEGSPAAEAGISSASVLKSVDGLSTADLGLEATAARLRGKEGTSVLLELITPSGKSQELELRRRQVDLQPVRSRLIQTAGHRLGYIRITQFAEPVPQELAKALQKLQAQDIDGLILDLRNNSGGLVSAGLAVANVFLDGGPIVETQNRDGFSDAQQASRGQLYDGPMLTLVNEGTASASEILAGALQDDERSPLLGSRTFGKGLIQTLIGLGGDGSGLAVTVARYLTPSGRDIQNLGIEPDQRLADPEPLNPGGDGDTWLEIALNQLAEQIDAG
ncbi:carboxyl-terminal processing protease CtpZ [Synechococcus sp. NB0720_010]|uniref:carboxyl-terminal processing protease CtpZ n=1 Tax=Synechococcus sp. NB0720_010 TaxID=2907159 RepID=UPI001FFBC0BC|nr:carboxyl-terminal processing protease CtpZ [Synechococcus sp. NB0720_010]UPH91206.1 S41 family peptidase [Synechococcus sp. NB0720_010]